MVTKLPSTALTGKTATLTGINLGEDNLTVYDEGTWTPVVKIGATTITDGTPTGKFIQVGKQVTVWFSASLNRGTNTGSLTMEGAPGAPTMNAAGTVSLSDYIDGSPPITVLAANDSGACKIHFYVSPVDTSTQLAGLTDSQLKASTVVTIKGTITYHV